MSSPAAARAKRKIPGILADANPDGLFKVCLRCTRHFCLHDGKTGSDLSFPSRRKPSETSFPGSLKGGGKTMKPMLLSLLVAITGAFPASTPAGASGIGPASSRLRFDNRRIGETIEFARRRSPIFRSLLAAVADSDLIVYVQEGRCASGALRS